MANRWLPAAAICFALAAFHGAAALQHFPLLMPKIHPQAAESYLCSPIRLNDGADAEHFYVTGFEPNATQHTAHHMLIYGCEEPGSLSPVWDCGEMAASVDEAGSSGLEASPPCRSKPQIIYAWAKDAPKLELPEGVGFRFVIKISEWG